MYKLQLVKKSPTTTQFTKVIYIGFNDNPMVIKDQAETKKDKINAKLVITATPFVPSLKPKKPEQILLNNGKNIIKLIIFDYYIKFKTLLK